MGAAVSLAVVCGALWPVLRQRTEERDLWHRLYTDQSERVWALEQRQREEHDAADWWKESE